MKLPDFLMIIKMTFSEEELKEEEKKARWSSTFSHTVLELDEADCDAGVESTLLPSSCCWTTWSPETVFATGRLMRRLMFTSDVLECPCAWEWNFLRDYVYQTLGVYFC